MREKRLVQHLHANGTPMVAQKFNRNDPCPCGSGLKNKRCCHKETKYYFAKSPKNETTETTEPGKN